MQLSPPGPVFRWRRRRVHAFLAFGLLGFLLASAMCLWLGARQGFPLAFVLLLAAAAIVTFLVVAMLAKILHGADRLVCYHHQLALFTSVAVAAAAGGRPVLAALDLAAAGFALFLACGRLGCWTTGCCHGRPASIGFTYTRRHVWTAGFPAALCGIPLAPVQLLEACAAAVIAAWCASRIAAGAHPGTAFFHYLALYSAARFALEFLRGDSRPLWRGLSEPQCTSLALLTFSSLVLHPAVLLAAIAAIACALPARRYLRDNARSVELAEILREARRSTGVIRGPSGFSASWGTLADGHAHYFVSSTPDPLRPRQALRLTGWIAHLEPGHVGSMECIPGQHGVVHILVRHA